MSSRTQSARTRRMSRMKTGRSKSGAGSPLVALQHKLKQRLREVKAFQDIKNEPCQMWGKYCWFSCTGPCFLLNIEYMKRGILLQLRTVLLIVYIYLQSIFNWHWHLQFRKPRLFPEGKCVNFVKSLSRPCV